MMMRKEILLSAIVLLSSACSVKIDGACNVDTDCQAGAVCFATNAGKACVIPEGGCFPACSTDQTCTSGQCVLNQCPAAGCQLGFTCSATTHYQCQQITTAVVTVTSPGANAYAGTNLQVTATAVAPGGTTGVRFEVRRAGTVLGSAQATKTPTSADPDNYAAIVPLTGSADGAATVVAIESWNDSTQAGKAVTTESPAVAVVVDLTPPALTLMTDGTTSFLGPGNSPAVITVTSTDTSGSGVAASGLKLTIPGDNHGAYSATAGANNQFTFSVPFADLGTTSTFTYSITAKDATGNVTTIASDPKEVIKVDATAPTGTLTVDNAWHAANAAVTVSGTVSDPQSGLSGGLAGVTVSAGTLSNIAGSISGNTYSVALDLSTQTFPVSEANFPITVTLSDQVGNTLALTGNIKVDNKPPTISAPVVTNTPDDAVKYFKGALSGNLTVNATVLDAASGVNNSTVTLQYQVAGQTLHTVSGSQTSVDQDGTEHWTFSLPRSAGLANGACGTLACDGTAGLVLTVVAQDTLAHAGTSAQSLLFFDSVGPTIAIAPDTTWHAATSTLSISATAADSGSGIDFTTFALTDGSGTTYPRVTDSPCTTSPCTISVPASDFPANTEGTMNLSLTVKDKVTNSGTGTGTRLIDGKPPTVTITKVYATGGTAGSSAVTYPTAISGTGYTTGYDGSHYLFGDSVHVKATVADAGSGVKSSGFQVRLDGLLGGAVATGTAVALTTSAPNNLLVNGCVNGAATCNIEFDLLLNGQFDAGTDLKGNFGIAVIATDVVNNQDTSLVTNVAATRFWWSLAPSSGSDVSGLAIHPTGAVVATLNLGGNNDSVYALPMNGPFDVRASRGCAAGVLKGVRWCVGHDFYGAGDGLGAVVGSVVIGDDINGQLIYAATGSGDVAALSGQGVKQWSCGATAFGNAIASPVVGTSGIGIEPSCEAIFFPDDNSSIWGVCNPSGSLCRNTSGSASDGLTGASVILSSAIYTGTSKHVSKVSVSPVRPFNIGPFDYFGPTVGAIDGLAFDGVDLYASSSAGSVVYQLAPSLGAGWTADFGDTSPQGLPVVRAPNDLLDTDKIGAIRTLSGGTGSVTPGTLVGLTKAGFTPLLGSDSRAYVGSKRGVITAVNESPAVIAWTFADGGTASFAVPLAMDCGGHLYAAQEDTVYAFITDAQGLRNTPWPKYQRDSRNTGNADRTASNGAPYGVFNGISCVQ